MTTVIRDGLQRAGRGVRRAVLAVTGEGRHWVMRAARRGEGAPAGAARPYRRYLLVAGGLMVAIGAAVAVDTVAGSPGADEIRTIGHVPVATVVFDRRDAAAFSIFQERRHEVPLAAMSPHLTDAVLAIEDQRFYEHRGLDLWRIAGSMWANLRRGALSQGGSTITQQLARQSLLTLEKTIRRKLKEAYLAVRIERMYTKDEILELYLNRVYLGDGLYGVEAASRGYFGKAARDLSIDEAALIAGLIQAPSAYDPTEHMDRAIARRAVVLNQMAGAGMIERAAARELAAKPVVLVSDADEASGAWFKQAVTRELVDRFGWERVSESGLRVFTTYDPVAQRAAEQALANGLTRIEGLSRYRHPKRSAITRPGDAAAPDYLQGALVAMDPASGEVRALVGGRDFSESQFDRVSQAHRQPGSAFKPFVYAAALEQGFSPATLITGLDQPIQTPQGPWLPADGHSNSEALTVRTALRVSSNRAAAQMLQTIGIQPAVTQARQLGLDAPPVPSLVLGSGDVTLMALTAAYGAFADRGTVHQPRLIRRVEDASGAVLFETRDQAHRAVSDATAYQMAAMLADVVDRGTGYQVRQAGFRLPAAGKTGTTNDYHDAWFVGFTPDLVAGVWVGFDQPRTIISSGYASDLAVPIWGTFMRDATAGARSRWLDRPSDVVAVEICSESGLLPNAACRRVHRVSDDGRETVGSTVTVEYFKRGTEPETQCPLHDYSWWHGVQTASFDPSDFPRASVVGALPAQVARAGTRTVPAGDATQSGDAPAGEPEPKQKGFWSRLAGVFGGGKASD